MSYLSGRCQESLMKMHNALWSLIPKRQGQKYFLGDSLVYQFRIIPETETLIILRISHQSAAHTAHLLQPRQAFIDKRFANALFLMLR